MMSRILHATLGTRNMDRRSWTGARSGATRHAHRTDRRNGEEYGVQVGPRRRCDLDQLWVHDATGLLTFQRWYTDMDASCQPDYLEDCRVGVPLSAVPSGNVTWWVRVWSPAGYSPWTTGQVVAPPGRTSP